MKFNIFETWIKLKEAKVYWPSTMYYTPFACTT